MRVKGRITSEESLDCLFVASPRFGFRMCRLFIGVQGVNMCWLDLIYEYVWVKGVKWGKKGVILKWRIKLLNTIREAIVV